MKRTGKSVISVLISALILVLALVGNTDVKTVHAAQHAKGVKMGFHKEIAINRSEKILKGLCLFHKWSLRNTSGDGCESDIVEHYVCVKCGKTKEKTITTAGNHDFTTPTCTSSAVCRKCGARGRGPLGHDWTVATCDSSATCKRCGVKGEGPLGHMWTSPTCTDPSRCIRCGKSKGPVPGHCFIQATCTVPQLCMRCGMSYGEPLGHEWKEGTDTSTEKCKRCGVIRGSTN